MAFKVQGTSGGIWLVDVDDSDSSNPVIRLQASSGSASSSLSTLTIQNVVNWARTHTKLVPVVGVGGFSNEPALSIANDVLQTMLSKPYAWKWNRVEAASFDTVENQQDYTASVTDMGWLEHATIEDTNSTQTPKPRGDIDVVNHLHVTSEVGNPEKLAWLKPTDTGLTWRLDKAAGSYVWTVYPVYQSKPPIKTDLTETWSPIPDELGYVIRQGFLAFAYRHADDPRAEQEYLKFIAMIERASIAADRETDGDQFSPAIPLLR